MKHKIAVKLVALAVTLTCVLACAAGVLEPHDVEIVLINPHTGEPMSRKEYIEEPPAGTPIEVKIKDLVTGEYLTDDDLPETTLADSITIGIVYYFDWDDNYGKRYENYYNLWPGYLIIPKIPENFKENTLWKACLSDSNTFNNISVPVGPGTCRQAAGLGAVRGQACAQ